MNEQTTEYRIGESDRRILAALQADATLTLKQLAEAVAMSPSTVWRRVQDLEAAGVIVGRVTLLDPARLGLQVCVFVHVDIRDHRAETRDAFERFVRGRPEVMECFSITGAHDYMLIVRTETVAAFEDFLMHALLSQPAVAAASSNFTLRQQKYTTALPL